MTTALTVSDRNNYGQTALDIIGESTILTAEDLNVIGELKEELVDNFMHAQVFRTRTEMEVSVLNDMNFPTPDSKYWQCQREQGVHFHELVMLSYEYRKNLVEIRKHKLKLKIEPASESARDLRRGLFLGCRGLVPRDRRRGEDEGRIHRRDHSRSRRTSRCARTRPAMPRWSTCGSTRRWSATTCRRARSGRSTIRPRETAKGGI